MKNIHLIPTEKPSRLMIDTIENKLYLQPILHEKTINVLPQHIYITSDEEIKEGDFYIGEGLARKNIFRWTESQVNSYPNAKKDVIILTTDQDLINDGVQPIDEDFLEWFVKNSSCETVEIENGWGLEVDIETPYYKIIIPCSCVGGVITCPGCDGEKESEFGKCAGCEGVGLVSCGKCGGKETKQEETSEKEQLPTPWFKTEQIETWIGESITTEGKEIEEIKGGRGKLIVMHQCGENKEELISQLETMINGLRNGFEYFAS
jgi:hypothetical protein